jgi:hypothetical protein
MSQFYAQKGTSLICLAVEDGIFLAADDLVYSERDGQAVPLERDFGKVGSPHLLKTKTERRCRP